MFKEVEAVFGVSVLSVILIVLTTIARLYAILRPRFPIQVNCWFCNVSTTVPFNKYNEWDCPSCEQYNGFTKSGGYNRVIPEQHDELLNKNKFNSSCEFRQMPPSRNVLCRKCNFNQALKIQQIALFRSSNPSCYVKEVEQYRLHLERMYRLCAPCDDALVETMRQQEAWLLNLRRDEFLRSSPELASHLIQRAWQLRPVWPSLCHGLCLVVGVWLVLATVLQLADGRPNLSAHFNLPAGVVQFIVASEPYKRHLTAIALAPLSAVVASRHCTQIDVLTFGIWLHLHCLCWVTTWPDLPSYLSRHYIKILEAGVSFITLLVGVVAALVSRRVSSRRSMRASWNCASKRLNYSQETTESFGRDTSPAYCVEHKHVKRINLSQGSNRRPDVHEAIESDLYHGFGKLRLGRIQTKATKNDSTHLQRRHFVLSPPKLISKCVTEFPWVVGGSWQMPKITSTEQPKELNRRWTFTESSSLNSFVSQFSFHNSDIGCVYRSKLLKSQDG